jgi:hypothetical protein
LKVATNFIAFDRRARSSDRRSRRQSGPKPYGEARPLIIFRGSYQTPGIAPTHPAGLLPRNP